MTAKSTTANSTTEKLTIVLSLARGSDPARRTLQNELAAILSASEPVDLRVIGHLYDLTPDGPVADTLRSIDGPMVVLASLYPRAAFWVLDAHEIKGRLGRTGFMPEETSDDSNDATGRSIWCIDLRPHNDAQPVLAEIERIATELFGRPVTFDAAESTKDEVAAGTNEETKLRWYPVIDYSRCQNCMECLNFCLFGVYGVDASDRILVEQPDACRAGCPACSRVCPGEAIMFPEHQTPVIAGDPTAPSDGFNTGLVQLLGTPNPPDLAAAERDRALAEKANADKVAEKDELDRLVDELDEIDL
ncbi:MAG TPA: ferredoxin family protein [Thermoguttaceae bacterium]|nr:ferredoxin family protein [Thermoguttaceae bacterium]